MDGALAAVGTVRERCLELLEATRGFHRTFLSCENRFFFRNTCAREEGDGNVREWCFDRDKRFSLRVLSDLQGEERGEIRAVRGESWSSLVYACGTTNRNWYSPQEIRSNIGFSVALTPRSK
ncbi:MAG: SUMF1/EgtB/PvdO family nonheme iron enzyme [Opitutales bacterium]|nr:SUMF1/EgtB/PvdO family nonheme iron enzyme [Opitutales bacterium]MBT5814649.1 SUMF1/EgtB/PvdO family nonheme iron enzyme [Opitutales bacterium]